MKFPTLSPTKRRHEREVRKSLAREETERAWWSFWQTMHAGQGEEPKPYSGYISPYSPENRDE